MMPPMSRRRILAHDLGRCLEVVLEDRVLELLLARVAARIDVDHRERLAVVEHEVAAGWQVDAALERAADALVDLEPLEQPAPAAVLLDPLRELRRGPAHVAEDALVLLLVVDHDLADLAAELVAHGLQGQVGLRVDERGRAARGLLRMVARRLPQLLEQAHIAFELVHRGARGRGAHDQARIVFGGAHALDEVAQARALVVVEATRDADAVGARRQHHEAAGQRHLHGQARALRAHGVLGDLHEQLLAGLDELFDRLAPPLTLVEIGSHDLVDVQESVLLEADVDECRLHAGQHRVDAGEVDVADYRTLTVALDVGLDELSALHYRNPHLLRVGRDEDAFHMGQWELFPGAAAIRA